MTHTLVAGPHVELPEGAAAPRSFADASPAEQARVTGALARTDALAGASADERAAVLRESVLVTLARGERLVAHDGVVLVESGRVACTVCDGSRELWTRAIVMPDEVGCLAGVVRGCETGDGPRCACTAVVRSELAVLDGPALRALMQARPAVAVGLARILAKDLETALLDCAAIATRTPLARLAHYLLDEADGRTELRLAETQSRIASRLGTVREVVGRGMRELVRRGLIRRDGRHVSWLDAAGLSAVAGA